MGWGMSEYQDKSCWPVAVWTFLVLGGVLAVTYLLGAFDQTTLASLQP